MVNRLRHSGWGPEDLRVFRATPLGEAGTGRGAAAFLTTECNTRYSQT